MSWPTVALGDICKPKQHKTIPSSKLLDDGFVVFGANGPIGYYSTFTHDRTTIAVTCRGATCGTINIVPAKSYITGNAMALDDLDEDRANLSFLKYALEHKGFSSVINGAAQPQITRAPLLTYTIPLPPLEEQKRIAGILDQADALCRLRRRALDRLNTLGQATFHEMFGDLIENSNNWPIAELGSLFHLKHGYAFKSQNFVSQGNYCLLSPGNFFEKGGFRDRGEKQKFHNDPVPSDFILEEGDMLIAMTEQAPGLLGSPIIVPESNKFLHNQRLGKVEKKVKTPTRFLFGLMNAPTIRARIQKDSTGLKVKHTSPKKIGLISIGAPPYELQSKYSDLLLTLDRRRTRMTEALQSQQTLFASLQHRAFRGEL